MKKYILAAVGAALLSLAGNVVAAPMGTAFTYQGRLGIGTNAASGSFDLEMRLFDAVAAGSQVAGPVTNVAVAVSNGLFTVNIDLGAASFNGNARWLGISVRTNGGGAFTGLTPRQELKPTPYALFASNAAVAVTASTVGASAVGTAGLQAGAVDSSKILDGTIVSGDLSSALLNSTFWRLLGNGGTTAGVNFLGTTDNQAVEIKVNGQRAFRLEPTTNSPNVIGGFSGNSVGNSFGATIAGGGFSSAPNTISSATANFFQHATIGGGAGNSIFDYGAYATVAGGSSNRIGVLGTPGQGALYSAIGGGILNSIEGTFIQGGNATACTIGGGTRNLIHSMDGNTIGGGRLNIIDGPSFVSSTIGGGESNSVSWGSYVTISGGRANKVLSADATVGGGSGNAISGGDFLSPATAAVIGGGRGNSIGQGSVSTTIAGGTSNSITAFADSSTISGGANNAIQSSALKATISGGTGNLVSEDYTVVSGGQSNSVKSLAHSTPLATVGGGGLNSIFDYSFNSTIGGGGTNTIGTLGSGSEGAPFATIAGGANNMIRGTSIGGGNSSHSTIGGGLFNSIIAMDANTIAGGMGNVIDDDHIQFSAIGGGDKNRVAGLDTISAWIGGGRSNYVHASFAAIAGGFNNRIDNTGQLGNDPIYAVIGGGSGNLISELCRGATIAGGIGNRIEKTAFVPFPAAAIGGGESNKVSSFYGTVPGGLQAAARNYGQMAYASGQLSSNGDAQTSVSVCRNTTADATQIQLFLDGSGARMSVATNSTWTFEIIVTGRTSSGNSAGYQISGVIENNGGTTALVGALTKTVLAEDIGSWDATVVADNTNDALEVKVTGAAATNIRWAATVRTMELIY